MCCSQFRDKLQTVYCLFEKALHVENLLLDVKLTQILPFQDIVKLETLCINYEHYFFNSSLTQEST